MTYNIREEGVDNFVDDKSLVNPIIKDFEARRLNVPKIFGVPRSGSTLMRNILNTIFDGRVKDLPPNEKNIKYFTYPNKRPTRLKDFIFICKIIKKEKPVLCISNFGSTNIVTIASYIFRISLRINYFHTSPQQLKIDSKRNPIYNWFLKQRKILILKMNTQVITNSSMMADLISESYKIKKDKMSVLPYLLEKSKNNRKPIDKRGFSICIVGRLS